LGDPFEQLPRRLHFFRSKAHRTQLTKVSSRNAYLDLHPHGPYLVQESLQSSRTSKFPTPLQCAFWCMGLLDCPVVYRNSHHYEGCGGLHSWFWLQEFHRPVYWPPGVSHLYIRVQVVLPHSSGPSWLCRSSNRSSCRNDCRGESKAERATSERGGRDGICSKYLAEDLSKMSFLALLGAVREVRLWM
jgi:hypothetical protein